MCKRIFIFIFIAATIAFPVFAENISMHPLTIRTAASSGFGGHHAAYSDNVFSLLVNPAAMVRVQQGSFFTLAPSLFSPQLTLDTIDSISDLSQGNSNSMSDMLYSLNGGKMGLGLELNELPLLSFAWVANGFGIGLWTNTFMNLNIVGFNMEVNVYADVILPIGFAFTILDVNESKHTLDAGFTLKPFARFMVQDGGNIISIADEMEDFIEDLNMPLIAGTGIDLGFLYRSDTGFSAGLTLKDVFSYGQEIVNFSENYSSSRSYYVPFTVNLGLAFDFRFDRFWSNAPSLFRNMGISAAFDWRDIGNAFNQDDFLSRNFMLDFGFGLQFNFADVFYARIGMNEMLPAIGFGLHFGFLEIDFAYYGREFGYEPGQLSVAVAEFSIAIRPGAKERNWPWVRRPIISR